METPSVWVVLILTQFIFEPQHPAIEAMHNRSRIAGGITGARSSARFSTPVQPVLCTAMDWQRSVWYVAHDVGTAGFASVGALREELRREGAAGGGVVVTFTISWQRSLQYAVWALAASPATLARAKGVVVLPVVLAVLPEDS